MKRVCISMMIFAIGALNAFSEAPVRIEELIYTIVAYNGRDYSATFCREESDTIYLYANGDSFLSLKKNFVYYWPITQEWKTDSSVLDVTFDGVLEIKGRGVEQSLFSVDYTYFNLRGNYENNWKAVKEGEAHAEWERYLGIVKSYLDAMDRYNREHTDYENRVNQLFFEISKLKQEGKDHSKKLDELNSLKSPEEPARPDYYFVPPVPVQHGYNINLPAGEYRMRFLTKDGKLMSGSEKKLIVFDKRRTEGIGFDIIPEDRWTMPSESTRPSEVLYVNGKSDLFIRPFLQNEYNDLYFNKLVANDARGNPNLNRWVKIQQVPKSSIELSLGKELRSLKEAPYMVEQVEGANLGYRIVDYDPDGSHKNEQPSIIAFRIPIRGSERKALSLFATDEKGTNLKGSGRSIRIIEGQKAIPLLLFIAACPLIAMGIILALRKRHIAERPREIKS